MPNSDLLFQSSDMTCIHGSNPDSIDEISARHISDGYLLAYFVEGKGDFWVEGCSYTVTPGTAILIFPHAYHVLTMQKNLHSDAYFLFFRENMLNPDGVKLLSELVKEESDHAGRISPSLHIMKALISSFERFSETENLTKEKRSLFAKSVLNEILVLLSTSHVQSLSADEGELAVRVLRFLNERPGQNLSLDDVAKHFFVSKYYLCRAFKAYNGISIHEYLLHKRVLIAKQYMESGETASCAAYRVGFGDYSAFYRAYVKVTGTSPVFAVRKKG